MALTFNQLRRANLKRLPQFRDRQGRLCHSKPDGSDWRLSQWCNAVTGELGEAANLIKKIERGDFTLEEARAELAKELADVVTYMDLLASVAGVDLGQATARKFNEVSERVKSNAFCPTVPNDLAYLASPHSHPDANIRQHRYEEAVRATAWLFKRGQFVYAPIVHTHEVARGLQGFNNWNAWALYDRMMLSLCDKLIVLRIEGWAQSQGVAAELEIAREYGIPVELMDPVEPAREYVRFSPRDGEVVVPAETVHA